LWIAVILLAATCGAIAAAASAFRHVRLYSTALIATGGKPRLPRPIKDGS
jgi:hypothetical protein